jgi:hypothetical protein
MFTKKQRLIVLLIFILSLSFFVFSFNNKVNLEKENKTINKADPLGESEIKTKLKENISPIPEVREGAHEANPIFLSENQVTINVLGNNYSVSIEEGESVFEVMQKLADYQESNFSFEYKNYPSLGIFIEKINGVNGKSGAYWIYYINDEEAKVGVSKQILKSGDVITWKQE